MKRGLLAGILIIILFFIIQNLTIAQENLDLAINFSWTPASPTAGETVALTVITQNIGSENTTNYSTKILINSIEFATNHTSGAYGIIKPGENRTEIFNLVYANGSSALNNGYSNITAMTDYLNENTETNEANNEVTRTVYVQQNQTCTQNWIAVSMNCTSSDNYIVWYNDTNRCNNSAGMPVNLTLDCDYNKNGIIGNFSSFSQTNINLAVYVDNQTANISQTFNTSKTIEFREGNLTRVKFDYAFSQPLNMKNITIIKQSSSSDFGYLIVNGIDVSKIITADILDSGSKVCVKNSHVGNISAVSNNCTGTSEYIVNCPGTNSSFSCNITNSKFVVSGLTSSAVREFSLSPANCTPSWNCSSWSSCINNLQTKTCNDINSCGVLTGKPATNQSCTPPPSCTPSWNCTEWTPEKCPENQTQTKICIDLNNCGVLTGKPAESKTCEYKPGISWLWITVISLVILLIIVVIILIIHFWRKENQAPRVQFQGAGNYYRP